MRIYLPSLPQSFSTFHIHFNFIIVRFNLDLKIEKGEKMRERAIDNILWHFIAINYNITAFINGGLGSLGVFLFRLTHCAYIEQNMEFYDDEEKLNERFSKNAEQS